MSQLDLVQHLQTISAHLNVLMMANPSIQELLEVQQKINQLTVKIIKD